MNWKILLKISSVNPLWSIIYQHESIILLVDMGRDAYVYLRKEFIAARHPHITKCMLGKYICTVGFWFLGLSSHNNL